MPYSDDITEGFLDLARLATPVSSATDYDRQLVEHGWATACSESWSVVLLVLSGRGLVSS
jgi:hypothetical protein